ncbi:MAG: hypothetical protein ACE5KU_05365 [Nitrososphaerales archaeon]
MLKKEERVSELSKEERRRLAEKAIEAIVRERRRKTRPVRRAS